MKFLYPGLTAQHVAQQRTEHGSNAVNSQAVESFWRKLGNNLNDPIIIILLAALAIITGLWAIGHAHWYEGVGIALAIAIATLVATWSEYSNEHKFQQLLEQSALILVKVFRDGQLVELAINELVVGDQILLQPGDTVPSDGYLIAGHLQIDQAALTGESEPVNKSATTDTPTDDSKIFRAALVIDGEAVMQTTAVGNQTVYGQTMKAVLTAEDRLSPLQQKLKTLGGQIALLGYLGSGLIFIAFMANHIWLQGGGWESYLATQSTSAILKHLVTAAILAITVIVMAVPEGLPMMIAMVLAINMKKLLQDHVLVRKLLGIETAGSLTLLFSDKTGTLTQGQLQVEQVITGDTRGYSALADLPSALQELIAFTLRNNTSAMIDDRNPQQLKIVGADRTEQALLRFIQCQLKQPQTALPLVDSISFNSRRKFSATQVHHQPPLTLVKGAAELILEHCPHYVDATGQPQPLTADDRAQLAILMSQLSARTMRLLAVAQSDQPITDPEQLPTPLRLLGIFALRDALRTNARDSVQRAQQAGIQVVMITGDAKETAMAIATDVGLLARDSQTLILTSSELAMLSDQQITACLPQLAVVARALPTDKSRLVTLAKQLDQVVGMTGDGVNDAPALKHSDVSFAMGSGTEMTKEASSITLLDDNFSSINKAVLYGRTLFKSIRKFLVFQLTVSFSAILVAFFGPFLGFDLPLTMTQLLWINMIMDTLAGLAFAGEAALERYRLEPPIAKDAPLINADMWSSILINGMVAAALSILFLTWPPIAEQFQRPLQPGAALGQAIDPIASQQAFLTAFFAFFVLLHLVNTFNARTQSLNLLENLGDNKLFLPVMGMAVGVQFVMITWGGDIMRTTGLHWQEWLWVIAGASLLLPVDLSRKWLRNRWLGDPVYRVK